MIKNIVVILLLISTVRSKNSDVGLDAFHMVRRHNYPIEKHSNIKTEDGYLLDMLRIPHGKTNSDGTDKPVAFLMHGLLSSSADWINMGPEKGLGYLLADAGYDVWIANARGTTLSRKHVKYDPNKDAKYWHFSWHEMGQYDLPAMIDYILSVTEQEQLFYIGHSQGTTSFFVMASERPEYNSKIRLMVALAPIAYMSHMPNPIAKFGSIFHRIFEWIMKVIEFDEFVPRNDLFMEIGQAMCSEESPFQFVCSSIMFMISGWDYEELNKTMIPVILSNLPAGASSRQFLHYAQEIVSGKFRQYDYGLIQNVLKYKSLSPPEYNIKNIVAPVGIFYAENDWMDSSEDVDQLASELPHLVLKYLVPYHKFNHLDYVFAIDVKELVYDRVLALMQQYLE